MQPIIMLAVFILLVSIAWFISTHNRFIKYKNRIEEESRISKSLRGILALAEAYPDLKASENFLNLQNSLGEIEEDIQQARHQYNGYVGRFNTLVESFPANFIAGKFGFEKQSYFALDLATQRELPEVGFSSSLDSKK